MTTAARLYAVQPIAADVVNELRHVDDAGREPQLIVDTEGGSPLRCCLRVSRPGEQMLLVSYAPVRRCAEDLDVDPGAYDEVGPIFIHPVPCDGPADTGWPTDLRGQPRVLRAYGANARLRDGRVVSEGEEPDSAIAELMADPGVAFIHARALVFGCYTFAITRPP